MEFWISSLTLQETNLGPLGITVFFQFLLLGAMAGALLGGSQGLARSMFGQMVPETRSAEFFGFFGFFGKVAALLGPLIYGIMTVWFDSRVGIFCNLTVDCSRCNSAQKSRRRRWYRRRKSRG